MFFKLHNAIIYTFNDMDIDQDVFNQNLLLTQAYCELQLQKPFTNNTFVLRTINPEYNGEPVFTDKPGKNFNPAYWPSGWNVDPLANRNLYDELFADQIQFKIEVIKDLKSNQSYKGRILAVEIDTTTCDGASSGESDGFIDGYDCPPVDTWFYLTSNKYGRVILAWIPEEYVEIVNNAINVNILDSFNWYVHGKKQAYDGSSFENVKRLREKNSVFSETVTDHNYIGRIWHKLLKILKHKSRPKGG